MTRERQRLLRAWRDWVNCNPREMLTKVLPEISIKNKACSQMPWTVSSQARQTNDCFRANSDLPFLLDPFQRVCNGEKEDLLFKSCTFPDSVNVPVKESMEVGAELGDRYWNQKTQIWTQQSLNLIPSDYEVSESVKEEGSSVCHSSASVTIGQWEEPSLQGSQAPRLCCPRLRFFICRASPHLRSAPSIIFFWGHRPVRRASSVSLPDRFTPSSGIPLFCPWHKTFFTKGDVPWEILSAPISPDFKAFIN